MFVLIYAVMFLAAGGILIEKYNPMQNTTGRDKGLALGSMAIIAGVVMFVDFVLLVKQIVKKWEDSRDPMYRFSKVMA